MIVVEFGVYFSCLVFQVQGGTFGTLKFENIASEPLEWEGDIIIV